MANKRAEEAALKAYPEKMGMFHEADIHYEADLNKAARIKYIEGYEQAEKETIERAVHVLINLPSLVIPSNYIAYFRKKMMEE